MIFRNELSDVLPSGLRRFRPWAWPLITCNARRFATTRRGRSGHYALDQQPVAGLALARAIAVCSYKSSELFSERFARRPDRSGEDPRSSLTARYDIAGYLDYQGSIFTPRFDANSYLVLSKAMDTFDLAESDESGASLEAALRRIRARLLLVGISSDWLFPASDVRALAWRSEGGRS